MTAISLDDARAICERAGLRVLEQETQDERLNRDWQAFLCALKFASDQAKNGARLHLTSHGYDPVATFKSAINRMVGDVLDTAIVEPERTASLAAAE